MSVLVVTARGMGMVRGLFMLTTFMMLGRFPMVACSVFVMFRSFVVMLCSFL